MNKQEVQREKTRQRKKRYRERKKSADHETRAKKVKAALVRDLGKPLTSQQMVAVDSDERRKAFIHFFYKYDGNVAAACAMVGVSRHTFNLWLSKYPEMAGAIEEINEAMLDLAEQQLMKNIANGKENSLFFFLCNKGKHRGWQDIRKLTGPQIKGMNVTINYPKPDPALPDIKVIPVIDVEVKDTDEKK